MNERIQELYDQCFVVLENDTPNTGFDVNKFAELIIRECARVVQNADLEDVDGGDSAVLRAASHQIKKHFGVE